MCESLGETQGTGGDLERRPKANNIKLAHGASVAPPNIESISLVASTQCEQSCLQATQTLDLSQTRPRVCPAADRHGGGDAFSVTL